ncbi:MAG: hypothetical protein CMJ83_00935 [Planctomycetes bacterium]|nr:hypothetical protein [Planctomycetota bacterium]
MSCRDPETSKRLLLAEEPDQIAWQTHLDQCDACRATFADLGDEGTPVHPAGEVLVDFDERPASLTEETRAYVTRHLDACDLCREALVEIPPLGEAVAEETLGVEPASLEPASLDLRRWMWPLTAAAGWIVVVVLSISGSGGTTDPTEPDELPTAVVLSADRAADAQKLPAAPRLSVAFILAEDFSVGDVIHVAVTPRGGPKTAERALKVIEVDEWGWPHVALDRSSLPYGALLIHARSAEGASATFRVVNER